MARVVCMCECVACMCWGLCKRDVGQCCVMCCMRVVCALHACCVLVVVYSLCVNYVCLVCVVHVCEGAVHMWLLFLC